MQDTPPASDTPESPPPLPPSQQESSNRTVMLILSYLGILALVPLLVEKDDPEVQWHAKHGLVQLTSRTSPCLACQTRTGPAGQLDQSVFGMPLHFRVILLHQQRNQGQNPQVRQDQHDCPIRRFLL